MVRIGRWAVVAVWVGLLLALARSQWPQGGHPPLGPPPPHGSMAADDAWMGVYMHGQKIGYSHSHVTPVADGYRFEEDSSLRLTVLEQVQTVRIVTDATTTPDFALRAFTIKLDSGLGVLDVRGAVENSTLTLHMGSGADVTDQQIPLGEPIYLPSSARARLRGELLAPGRTMMSTPPKPTTTASQRRQPTISPNTTIASGTMNSALVKVRAVTSASGAWAIA